MRRLFFVDLENNCRSCRLAEVGTLQEELSPLQMDFRDYPPVLRQAISVARRMQDPLIEFCKLVNPDDDILALKLHTLQVCSI